MNHTRQRHAFGVLLTLALSMALVTACSTDATGPTSDNTSYHVVFLEAGVGGYEVGTCTETGEGYRSVSLGFGGRHNTAPQWSPSGRRLVYISDDTLKLVDVVSGTVHVIDPVATGFVADDGKFPAWSPDGSRFIAIGEDSPEEIALFDSSGSLITKTVLPDGWGNGQCIWSPRGDRIAISTKEGVGLLTVNLEPVAELTDAGALINWNSTGTHLITTESTADSWATIYEVEISTEAREIVFVIPTAGRMLSMTPPSLNAIVMAAPNAIERYDLQARTQSRIELPWPVQYVELRPDGKSYIYHGGGSADRLDGDIHTVNVDGTNDRVIKQRAYFPRWSRVKW